MALSANDLKELKTLGNPPVTIIKTVRAAMLLMGYSDEEVKDKRYLTRFMGNKDLFKKLIDFDASKVPPEQVSLAKQEVADLEIDVVKKSSLAAASFYNWVVQTIQKCQGASSTS